MTRLARLSFRSAALAAAALALAGCSLLPASLGGPAARPKPAELVSNPASLPVRQAWTARIGNADMHVSLQVAGTTVFAASTDGSVAAFDGTSGRELWRANAGDPLAAGVGSDGSITAVVTTKNEVVAFIDGKEAWKQRLASGAYTSPFVAGQRVFVLTADRTVSAFDGRTGRKLWTSLPPRNSEPLVLRHPGMLLAIGDTLVAGVAGRVTGISPQTGGTRWEAPIATPRGVNDIERLVDLVGPASRVGTSLCARAFQAGVGCIDAQRGSLVWAKAANGAVGLGGDETMVFGAEGDGKVVAWKRDSGERAWQTDMLSHRDLSGPLALGRSVVVGDGFGYVHLLSREDGKLLNRMPTDGSPIVAAPVLAGNTMVVLTRNGGLYGFVPQ